MLAAVFFYVATMQQKQEASFEKASAQFDLDFAKTRAGDSQHWEKLADKKAKELISLEEKEFFANEKSQKIFEELEKNLK